MNIHVENMILAYHRDIVYSNVIGELKNRQRQDRYYVTTEEDPFFTRGRRQLPLIPVTTIGSMKAEPTGINRRNRRCTLFELTEI